MQFSISEFNLSVYRESRSSRLLWRYQHADWPRLRHFYTSTDWQSIFSDKADESCAGVTGRILEGMKQFIPSKTLHSRPNDPCWWTPECTDVIKSKEKAWKTLRKSPTDTNRTLYRCAVTRAANQLRTSKHAHLHALRQRLHERSMPDKDWWSTIKQLGGKGHGNTIPVLSSPEGQECVTNQEKADCLAQFFASKCSLEDDFVDDSFPVVHGQTSQRLCNVRFRPSTVERTLKQLDTSKATGPDGIPARVLKNAATSLALPLSRLFNQCFASGCQPASWKVAWVVPIYKRKSKSIPNNYRPVSLLSILSKVMESIVNRQVINFLESNNILSTQQFGFRRGLGTADLLTRLQHEWSSTLAASGEVHVLAADIAGAFDKVSHRGVLHKAKCYGLSGKLLAWLTSYLSARHLQVIIGGQHSSLLPIQAGVPQGSILGPTLFLIYVNDCEYHLPAGVKLAVYADDTTLYKCFKSRETLESDHHDLQDAVDALSAWGSSWKIKFEPTKSQALTISHHRPPWRHPTLKFDGTAVEEHDSLKLLGVTFDRQLSFRSHLRSVAVRGRQRLYFLRRVAPLLDTQGRERVYKGFVRPVLEYCPLVWMGASATALAGIDAVQQSAIKLINTQAWLPSLDIRRSVAALSMLYKLLSLPPTSPLQSLVPKLSEPHELAHSTRHQMSAALCHSFPIARSAPRTARNTILRAFPAGILSTWNSLPASLIPVRPDHKNLQSFKGQVYHHLRNTNWEWATARL